MTTANAEGAVLDRSRIVRRSTRGMITPRRLVTPARTVPIQGTGVTASTANTSRTFRRSMAYRPPAMLIRQTREGTSARTGTPAGSTTETGLGVGSIVPTLIRSVHQCLFDGSE